MPVTLPAHAAAILPLCHERLRFLPPVALLVGSAAPDLSYLVGVYGTAPHSLRGMFEFCLPAGLIAYLWAELLILPLWRKRAPRLGRFELSRFAVSPGLPRSWSAWPWVVVSILIGTATHLLWDGLTHTGDWPERVLFAGARVELGGFSVTVARVLWGLSSVIASIGVLWWWARRYPRMAPATEARLPAWPLLLALVAGGAFGIAWRTVFPIETYGAWQLLWAHFWAAARYATAAMTALAIADRFGWFTALLTRPWPHRG